MLFSKKIINEIQCAADTLRYTSFVEFCYQFFLFELQGCFPNRLYKNNENVHSIHF